MIDHSIDHAHRQAEAMERDAKTIDDRLRALGVPDQWFNRRRGLGELRNPYGAKHNNLSVRAILEQKDRSLAFWLAQREGQSISGIDYAAQEQAERWAASNARLQEQTAALKARNQAFRKRHEQQMTYGRRSITGGWV